MSIPYHEGENQRDDPHGEETAKGGEQNEVALWRRLLADHRDAWLGVLKKDTCRQISLYHPVTSNFRFCHRQKFDLI